MFEYFPFEVLAHSGETIPKSVLTDQEPLPGDPEPNCRYECLAGPLRSRTRPGDLVKIARGEFTRVPDTPLGFLLIFAGFYVTGVENYANGLFYHTN